MELIGISGGAEEPQGPAWDMWPGNTAGGHIAGGHVACWFHLSNLTKSSQFCNSAGKPPPHSGKQRPRGFEQFLKKIH